MLKNILISIPRLPPPTHALDTLASHLSSCTEFIIQEEVRKYAVVYTQQYIIVLYIHDSFGLHCCRVKEE